MLHAPSTDHVKWGSANQTIGQFVLMHDCPILSHQSLGLNAVHPMMRGDKTEPQISANPVQRAEARAPLGAGKDQQLDLYHDMECALLVESEI